MKLVKKSKHALSAKDLEKENKIRELASQLEQAGYKVRREKLKQGPGWKTMSGSCRVQSDKLIFVDRKNPLDDQILFLKSMAERVESFAKESVSN